MLWNSWAKSWGSAWAESWGPLEEQEQQTPHGGADSISARLAREAVEKARRKAAQKRREEYEQEAQEALDALDASRQVATAAGITEALTEGVTENLQQVEATPENYLSRVEVTLPSVNDLFAKLASSIIAPATVKDSLIVGNDDAIALIMILAEMD